MKNSTRLSKVWVSVLALSILLLGPSEGSAKVVGNLMSPSPVSAGLKQAFAIHDGKLYGWGYDWDGRLGTGLPQVYSRPVPTPVAGFGTVSTDKAVRIKAVATGYTHTLALTESGRVYAWGQNTFGQLGDGTTNPREVTQVPKLIAGLTGIVAIAVGNWHSMALRSDGRVIVWGRNDFAQLGIGTTTTVPKLVGHPYLTGIKAISAGWYHSMAVNSAGKVYAWGSNMYGQIGNGSWGGDVPVLKPVVVSGAVTGSKVSAGRDFSMILDTQGRVWTMGRDMDGQLGDSSAWSDSNIPVKVPGFDFVKIVSIAAGEKHALALSDKGRIYAWGDGGNGALGITGPTDRFLPVMIDGPRDPVVAISASVAYSMAADRNGGLFSWGVNDAGQFGTGASSGTADANPAKSQYSYTYKVLVLMAAAAATEYAGVKEEMRKLAEDIYRMSYRKVTLEVDYLPPVVTTPAEMGCKGTNGTEDSLAFQNFVFNKAHAAGIVLSRYGHIITIRGDDLSPGCNTTSIHGDNWDAVTAAPGVVYSGIGVTYLFPTVLNTAVSNRNVVAHEFFHGFGPNDTAPGFTLSHLTAKDCKLASGAAYVPNGTGCTWYNNLYSGMNMMTGVPAVIGDPWLKGGQINEATAYKAWFGWINVERDAVSYSSPFVAGAPVYQSTVKLGAADAETISPAAPPLLVIPVQGSTTGEYYAIEYRPKAIQKVSITPSSFDNRPGVYLSVITPYAAGPPSVDYIRSAAKDDPAYATADGYAFATAPLPVGSLFTLQDGLALKVTAQDGAIATVEIHAKPRVVKVK